MKYLKTKLGIILGVIASTLFSLHSKAQTYSTFSSPSNGVEYSSGTTGICTLCTISNPEKAADTDGTNFATISVPAAVAGSAYIKLKLTDTVFSGDLAGLMIDLTGGLASSTIKATYTINTYLGGVQQESKSGSNLTAQLKSGSSTIQSIHFTSSSNFDEIEFVVGSLALALNSADVFYAYGNATALPIKLTKFYGSAAGEQIRINWTTASEYNSSYFEVEKLDAYGNARVIGTIPGAGNSSKIINYTYTDLNPIEGDNYYRLMQVDYDGAYEYSKVIKVSYGVDRSSIAIANDYDAKMVAISSDNDVSITLVNSYGEVIGKYNGYKTLNIDLRTFKPGVYYLKITTISGRTYNEKIVRY